MAVEKCEKCDWRNGGGIRQNSNVLSKSDDAVMSNCAFRNFLPLVIETSNEAESDNLIVEFALCNRLSDNPSIQAASACPR
jgi:hypothetical protein